MFSNYGVGWVERNETQLGVRTMLGFVPQTPLLSTRGTRAQEWLPNLQLMLILGLKTVPRPFFIKSIPKGSRYAISGAYRLRRITIFY